MIFVFVFLGIVTLSLVFLFRAGTVTSEKMRVQNAADAAAYSVAVVEARDLNFAAYINRAMVANEVAVAQTAGLLSWAHNWKSYGHYLMAFHDTLIRPIVGIITLGGNPDSARTAFGLIALPFEKPGELASDFIRDFLGKFIATAAYYSNEFFSQLQHGFHSANALYALSTLPPVIAQNAPGRAGRPAAQLSGFGFLSLLAHLETFGAFEALPGPSPLGDAGSFVKVYTPASDEAADITGFERFAAITRSSRDEFAKGRGWDLPFVIPPILPLDINIQPPKLNLLIAEFEFRFWVKLSITLERKGGSELRKTGAGKGEDYNWSAGDTTSMELDFDMGVSGSLCDTLGLGLCVGGLANVVLGNAQACATLIITLPIPSVLGGPVDVTVFDQCIPMQTGAGWSAGSGQVQGGAVTMNTGNMSGVNTSTYHTSPTHPGWNNPVIPYIGSPSEASWSTRKYPGPIPGVVPTVAQTIGNTANKIAIPSLPFFNPGGGYGGLQKYIDTTFDPNMASFNITADYPVPPNYGAGAGGWMYGFKAPYFITGVQMNMDDLYTAGFPMPTGQFQLNDRAANNLITATAKSEVYYARPNDLNYFGRADNLTEYGSTFNPYWQARLVPMTEADRMVSVNLQQGANFGSLTAGPNINTWNLIAILNALSPP